MTQMSSDFSDARSLRGMITPEGVDLRLSLADVGQRFTALVLDLLIIGAAGFAFTLALGIALFSTGFRTWEPLAVVWLLGWFLLRNFYFTAFEAGPRGATPGKRRMGLRVASRNGGRLTVDAVFVRNALRELELYLPLQMIFTPALGVDAWIKLAAVVWCGVFALFPLFNKDRLRVGDLLAGTWVVRNPARRLVRDLTDAGSHERARIVFTTAQLDAYGIKELHVLEDVLRRFDAKTVKAVADRIRVKIDYTQDDESDGAFLNAYYAALRARLEARALMGRRRRDKFDRD